MVTESSIFPYLSSLRLKIGNLTDTQLQSHLDTLPESIHQKLDAILGSCEDLYCTTGSKSIYGVYERPPFPIIIDTPTLRDVVQNLRFSDFVMGGSIYGGGVLWAYLVSRPFPNLSSRLVIYHGVSHMFFFVAFSMMFSIPYKRLTGFWDNGLRWRKPEDKLKKYDNTSEFEKATIWKRFRINEN